MQSGQKESSFVCKTACGTLKNYGKVSSVAKLTILINNNDLGYLT